MRLHAKLMLLTLLPVLLALAVVAALLQSQKQALIEGQQTLLRQAYEEATQNELRHYTAMALSAVSPLYNTGRDDAEIRAQAIARLAQLDYGPDGYFFVYDWSGVNLMHPRQRELVGRNLMDWRDTEGRSFIRQMIDKARVGGGFVQYTFQKPSTGQLAPKMAYVTGLERWQWMIGTGLYIDDLDQTLAALDAEIVQRINATQRATALVALAAIGLALLGTAVLNFNELRAADARVTAMARQVVRSQEDERARLSRELHDGVGQLLVSVKLLTESAIERLPAEGPAAAARSPLQRALGRLEQVLGEVRHLSHRLRPSELDQLGLPTALREAGREMCEAAGLRFEISGGLEASAVKALAAPHLAAGLRPPANAAADLPEVVATTLFRVAQEAMTNVVRHARARTVRLTLQRDADGLRMGIEDDGCGFDIEAATRGPRTGIGLANMRERLAAIGGDLQLSSRPQRTQVLATLPTAAIRRFEAGEPGAPGAATPPVAPVAESSRVS